MDEVSVAGGERLQRQRIAENVLERHVEALLLVVAALAGEIDVGVVASGEELDGELDRLQSLRARDVRGAEHADRGGSRRMRQQRAA